MRSFRLSYLQYLIAKEIISKGGRFLLNLGPDYDGTFDPYEERILGEFGKLLKPK
jgi:alpha-L-fucosidase